MPQKKLKNLSSTIKPFIHKLVYSHIFKVQNNSNIFNHKLQTDLPNATVNSFEVADDYFQNFTPNILEQIRLQDFINTLPRQNVYLVPSEYFQNFKVKEFKANKLSWLKKSLAIAASVALIIGSVFYIMDTATNNDTHIVSVFQDISAEDANLYIHTNIDEFEQEMIVSLDKESTISKKVVIPKNQITADEANEYLNTNESIDL